MELYFQPMPLVQEVAMAPNGRFAWKIDNNIRVFCRDDAIICVSTLESKIMHELALKRVKQQFDLSTFHCPHNSQIKTESRFSDLNRLLNQFKPVCRGYNIFGKSLEETVVLERNHYKYHDARINNQYKLHLPHFLVEAIKLIEKFGMNRPDIFVRPGDALSVMEIKRRISSGKRYSFYDSRDLYEVASLLKLYLKRIPGGIFTPFIEHLLIRAKGVCMRKRLYLLGDLMQILPRVNREAAFLVLSLLHQIAFSTPDNEDHCRRLSIEFAPILFHFGNENETTVILRNLIDCFPIIFTLQAEDLYRIYRTINEREPDKLLNLLQQRVKQVFVDNSDIPISLMILTGQTYNNF